MSGVPAPNEGFDPSFFLTTVLSYLLKLERKKLLSFLDPEEILHRDSYLKALSLLVYSRLAFKPQREIIVPVAVPIFVHGTKEAFSLTTLAVGVNELILANHQEVRQARAVEIKIHNRRIVGSTSLIENRPEYLRFRFHDTSLKDKQRVLEFLGKEFEALLREIITIIPLNRRLSYLQQKMGITLNGDWRRLYIISHQFRELSQKLIDGRLAEHELKKWSSHYQVILQQLFDVHRSPLLEKREFFRIPLRIPLNLEFTKDGFHGSLTTFSRDIGLDGFCCYAPQLSGKCSSFTTTMQFFEGTIVCQGEISWHEGEFAGFSFHKIGQKKRRKLFSLMFDRIRELVFFRGMTEGHGIHQ